MQIELLKMGELVALLTKVRKRLDFMIDIAIYNYFQFELKNMKFGLD